MATYDPNDPKQKAELDRLIKGLRGMPTSMRDKLVQEMIGSGRYSLQDLPDSVKSPSLIAATGADTARKEYQDLADKQWDDQMKGLDRALGETGEYSSAASDFNKRMTETPSNTSEVYGDVDETLKGPLESKTTLDDLRKYLGDEQTTKEPGMHEKFVQQSLDGKNPYWERLNNESVAKINQEMARRGHFDSGGAGTAIGNYLGAANAAQWRELGDLTKSGQAAGMDRSKLALDQWGLLGSTSSATDHGVNARAGTRMDLAGTADDQDRIRRLAGLNALGDAAGLKSNLYGGFYGAGGNFRGSAIDNGINAGTERDQFKGQNKGQTEQPGVLGKAVNAGVGWVFDYVTGKWTQKKKE